jgi:hypothetical protein
MELRRSYVVLFALAAFVAAAALIHAQAQQRALSPRGTASTQVAGKWIEGQRGQIYQEGKWIDISYGRPIKRDRADLFGSGEDYGKRLTGGAPVWRAGADQTTRITTEAALRFGGQTLAPGEYSVFVDLRGNEWTFIVSGWPAQEKYDRENRKALWGAYNYTPDKDVLRAPMKVEKLPFSVDQFTIAFIDVTAEGGRLAMMWDTTMAAVPFSVAR